jgi:enamine deaminase RidA (YjgF/YER057c/UK114 family)
MLKVHVLDTLHPHSRNAAHAVEVPSGARLLFTNGQTGTAPDGITPESTEEQALVAFERLRTILQAANMTFGNIVRLNTYLIHEDDIEVFLDVRDRILGAHKPASTFYIIKALVRPELKIEIEAVAAKADHVLASSLS